MLPADLLDFAADLRRSAELLYQRAEELADSHTVEDVWTSDDAGQEAQFLHDATCDIAERLRSHAERLERRAKCPSVDAEREPIFTLRARDILAAETVRFWAHLAEESNVPEAKIAGALQIADAMDAWPEHRLPD